MESSCDESALALFDPAAGLCGEWVHSQVSLHQRYGGVVPDLASREHLGNFGWLLGEASRAEGFEQVERIAVTCGPGLAGCLAIGLSLAKSLALAKSLPLVGVNHLRGHAFSPFIPLHSEDPTGFRQRLAACLPHLGLLASGGNTLLFRISESLEITILAQTVDDAAGEALDKGAKLLGMDYPGGPLMEKAATGGNPERFDFPAGIPEARDWRFSFSGLKTSLRYRLEKMDDAQLALDFNDLCASYQQAVVHQLIRKTRHVLRAGKYASLGLSGGVANNTLLRESMETLAEKERLPLLPALKRHTGDNAAMIAFAAWVDPAGCLPAERLSFHPALTLTGEE
ncbi:tRNA (adenosine(37)-N6)-threonylcarbamoyltransferase complex transferase subunit TsaD [Ruficoccus amylovorans]|uniref:tRNA (adenosine(37)-N6)-threonylcarbamoyltransferase complex transferase subunit TsaD n=1 Tax=Ruficoccus amylovorans TaxID=1804625 RepID=UPI0031B63505